MGINYYDYIVADKYIIPPHHQVFYTEKVAYLPDSYMPAASKLNISEQTPTRIECGLPEKAFVFCAFSHTHKILPPMFDIWMRLLINVVGSVLWLTTQSHSAKENLRKEAYARGVEPSRLIFAERVPLVEDHLARYRQADIFLDTYPYNAHTTAADALMIGLPVVTRMGESFPSRVAGSLLNSIGVPELTTKSFDEYENLALRLANDELYLTEIRTKLMKNVSECTLFETDKFCLGLEATYMAMWRKSQLGTWEDGLSMHTTGRRSA
jgi:predicted O-linked N-acetylglucosamine transferase (SPINDLY family)